MQSRQHQSSQKYKTILLLKNYHIVCYVSSTQALHQTNEQHWYATFYTSMQVIKGHMTWYNTIIIIPQQITQNKNRKNKNRTYKANQKYYSQYTI